MTKRLLQFLALCGMVLAMVPLGLPDLKLTSLGDLNVDTAFQLALPYFIEQPLQFGKQIVFTYGPWGILLGRYSGPTFHSFVLIFHVVLALAVFSAFWVLCERNTARFGRAVAWVGTFILISVWLTGQRDSYYLFPALLVTFQHLGKALAAEEDVRLPAWRWEPLLWGALTVLSAWLALAKFNVFVVAGVGQLLILINDVRRRRWPVLPSIYLLALVVAWMLAGQALSDLPLWVSRSLDLSTGYTDAMSKGFFAPYSTGLVTIYYLATGAIMAIGIIAAAWHRWRVPALLLLLFTMVLCAISVKHGMGGNQIEQSLGELGSVLWFQVLLFGFSSTEDFHNLRLRRWRRVAARLVVFVSLCFVLVAHKTNFPIVGLGDVVAGVESKVVQLANSPRDALRDGWHDELDRAHQFWRPGFEPQGQTIDIYPQQTGIVIDRKGLSYSPRPAFLSLNAHTYRLAMLNASHLQGSDAPDLVLFQVLPRELSVNNRLPALADGPSWPLLLSNYALEGTNDDFLLLKRKSVPLQSTRKVLFDGDVRLGEKIPLPATAGKLVWAEVTIRRTPLGALIHELYKSPHVLLESQMGDGKTETYQIVPELGRAGFLVSPLVQNNAEFAGLYLDGREGNVVRSISFTSPGAPPFFWKETLKLKLWVLDIGLRHA